MKKTLCKCGNPRRHNQRECMVCHAAYMREYRRHKKELKRLAVKWGTREVHYSQI